MPATRPLDPVNSVILSLPEATRHRLLDECRLSPLPAGALVGEGHRDIANVYFPVDCLLAAMIPERAEPPLALLLVGRQGMLGASLGLHVRETPFSTCVLLPGQAWQIGRAAFLRQLQASQALRRCAQRQFFQQSRQVVITAACAHFHKLEGRLAFWLLMIGGEVRSAPFRATHLQLAQLLGVQRAAVSIAASALRGRGAIHYSRGEMRIDRRESLERWACACYWRYRKAG